MKEVFLLIKLRSLFRQSAQKGKGTQALAVTAMFIALIIVFNRLTIWAAPTLKIGFGFLALACIARLYGPVMAMKAGAIADIVSYILYPVGGFYFPGFTLTGLLEGMVYGCCLYGGSLNWRRVLLARMLVSFLLNVGLNSFWLKIFYGQAILTILPMRLLKSVLLFPVDVLLLFGLIRVIDRVSEASGHIDAKLPS